MSSPVTSPQPAPGRFEPTGPAAKVAAVGPTAATATGTAEPSGTAADASRAMTGTAGDGWKGQLGARAAASSSITLREVIEVVGWYLSPPTNEEERQIRRLRLRALLIKVTDRLAPGIVEQPPSGPNPTQ